MPLFHGLVRVQIYKRLPFIIYVCDIIKHLVHILQQIYIYTENKTITKTNTRYSNLLI